MGTIDKDIRCGNHLPGTERYTKPEEIKALSKFLKQGISDKEKETTLLQDNLAVPTDGRNNGPKYKEITELSNVREDIVGNLSEVNSLSRDRLNIVKNPDQNLSNIRLNLDPEDNIELSEEQLKIEGNEDSIGLSDIRLDIEAENNGNSGGEVSNELSKERVDLETDKEVRELSKKSLKIKTDEINSLEDIRLDLEKEDIKSLSKEQIQLKKEDKVKSLSDDVLRIKGNNIQKLNGEVESIPGNIKEVDKLENDPLKINDKPVPELSNFTEKITPKEIEELDRTVLDIEKKEVDLSKSRVNIEKQEVNELSSKVEKISENTIETLSNISEKIKVEDIEELSRIKETIDSNEIQSLSKKVESIRYQDNPKLSKEVETIAVDNQDQKLSDIKLQIQERQDIELSKDRPDIEDKEINSLSKEKETLDNLKEPDLSSIKVSITNDKTTKLSDKKENIDVDEEVNLSDHIEKIKDTDDVELSEKVLEIKGKEVKLDNTRKDIDPKDVDELSSLRLDISSEDVDLGDKRIDLQDPREPELSDKRLDINPGDDVKLSDIIQDLLVDNGNWDKAGSETVQDKKGSVHKLTDLKEITGLSDIRLDITGKDVELSDIVIKEPKEKEVQLSDIVVKEPREKEVQLSDTVIKEPEEKEVSLSDIVVKEPKEKEVQLSDIVVKEPREKEVPLSDIVVKEPKEKEVQLSDTVIKEPEEKEVSLSDIVIKEPREKEVPLSDIVVKEPREKEVPLSDTVIKEPEEKEVSLSDLVIKEPKEKDVPLSNILKNISDESLEPTESRFGLYSETTAENLDWLNLSPEDKNKLSEVKELLKGLGEWGQKIDTYLTSIISGSAGQYVPESKVEAYKNLFKAAVLPDPGFVARPDHVPDKQRERWWEPPFNNNDPEFDEESFMKRRSKELEAHLTQIKADIKDKQPKALNGKSDAVETPGYKAPGSASSGVSGLIRLTAENTVGRLPLGGALKTRLITETLLLLTEVRNIAEKASGARPFRLPGGGGNVLGTTTGMMSAASMLSRGVNVGGVLGAIGNMVSDAKNKPYNRPIGDDRQTTKKNNRKLWVAPGQIVKDKDNYSQLDNLNDIPKKSFIDKALSNSKSTVYDDLVMESKAEVRTWGEQLWPVYKTPSADGFVDFGLEVSKEFLLTKKAGQAKTFDEFRALIPASSRMTTPDKFTSTSRVRNYMTLDSNHVWEVVIRPYVGTLNGNKTWLPNIAEIDLENKAAFNITTHYCSGWLPITGFELQHKKLTSKELALHSGAIYFPIGMELTNELRITFADDSMKSIRRYFELAAKTAVYMSNVHVTKYSGDCIGMGNIITDDAKLDPTVVIEGKVCPAHYKNISFLIDIFVMTPQLATINRTQLLCVLKDFVFESQGETDSSPTELAVNFSVVGEWPSDMITDKVSSFSTQNRPKNENSFGGILNNLGGVLSSF